MKCLIIEDVSGWMKKIGELLAIYFCIPFLAHQFFISLLFFFSSLELIKFITIIPRVLKLGIPVFVTQLCL